MLKNYFTIAWRNLLAHRLYSAINVLGLMIGLASCILILLFVNHEMSYDKQSGSGGGGGGYDQKIVDADRIVRVVRHYDQDDYHTASIAAPIGPALKEDFSEIEAMARIVVSGGLVLKTLDDRLVPNITGGFADPAFFELFDLNFIQGGYKNSTDQEIAVVFSESLAERLYGTKVPLGETFSEQGFDFKVAGVFQDLPENTHFKFDTILPISMMYGFAPGMKDSWEMDAAHTYLRLPPGYDKAELEAKFPAFLAKHLGDDAPDWNWMEAQWISDIHLHSNLINEMKASGSVLNMWMFSCIAAVILVIACINFMNLSTARSTQRAKEVGMRKVVGARRGQLVLQFLGESILLTAVAMLLAVALVELLLPWFSSFVERKLEFNYLSSPTVLFYLIGGVLGVGVLAGSYPAFHLTSIRPVEALKGRAVQRRGSIGVRKTLVVVQFAISITLMIATGVILAQLDFNQTTDLGYDRENNLIANIPQQDNGTGNGTAYLRYPPVRDALLAHSAIESVTISLHVPTNRLLGGDWYDVEGLRPETEDGIPLKDVQVGFGFFEHYGIELVAGRPFGIEYGDELLPMADKATPPDGSSRVLGQAIISETALQRLGFTEAEDAIGQILQPEMDIHSHVKYVVVGVAKDIHFSSLHDAIRPIIYQLVQQNLYRVSIKAVPGQMDAAYTHVESVWRDQFPDEVRKVAFLDDYFDEMYLDERRQAQVFGTFAGLAIFVASLGLFGLASFTTERRTKEIGIRKVMGASVSNIVILLTREFNILVVIANILAWPAAYYLMSAWLTRFVFPAPFGPSLFVGAAFAAFLIAWITVASLAGKAAMSHPIQALRYE